MRILKFLGIRDLEDFAFGVGLLILSAFTLYVMFFPLTPVLNIFNGQSLSLTIITFSILFFSIYISIGWVLQTLIGLLVTIKHKFSPFEMPKAIHNPHPPTFTILVPACNEEKVIHGILEDICKQTYPHWVCIVVCHNCTDSTSKVVARHMEKEVRIRLLEFHGPAGKPNALNHGLQYAEGDLVTVIDADGRIPSTYLEKLVNYFPKYDASQSVIEARNPSFNLLTKMQDLEFLCFTDLYQHARRVLHLNCLLGGTGQTVKRKVLEKLGGWSKGILADDYAMTMDCSVNNYKIAFAVDTVVYDEKVPYWSGFLRQRARWLRGSYQVLWRNLGRFIKMPANWHILLSPLGASFFFFSYVFIAFSLIGLPMQGFFLPSIISLSLSLLQTIIILCRIILKRGFKNALYLPIFLLYLYHWIPAFFFISKVRTWKDSKTPHGYL